MSPETPPRDPHRDLVAAAQATADGAPTPPPELIAKLQALLFRI